VFKHILIATDGAPLSERAALRAVHLAQTLSAQVTAIHVSDPFHVHSPKPSTDPNAAESYNRDCEKRAAAYLAVVGNAAVAAGVAFDSIHVSAQHASAEIIAAADDKGCDVICMASHGRTGLAAVFLGSAAVEVLTHSHIPVLVWR
jgi:nucleotide-binding universal stress UspA family protein